MSREYCSLLIMAAAAVVACGAQPSASEDGEGPGSAQAFQGQQQPAADGSSLPIEMRLAAPEGYQRVDSSPGSFGHWLRHLPVRAGRPPVLLYDKRLKSNQSAHYAVLDVDVGDKDLQQCADAVIRLRAEYLFSGSCRDQIGFNFTSGHPARWSAWRDGQRPSVSGNHVTWRQNAPPNADYRNFRRYLETVFTYAGSASLEQELRPVPDPSGVEIGDVFIKGGFPGHAVLVVDVAQDAEGRRAFLLAQSYMPAQDIHILRSFDEISPWYQAKSTGALRTPEWTFRHGDLRRFPPTPCDDGQHER